MIATHGTRDEGRPVTIDSGRLADEHAAVRRIAALAVEGAPTAELFAAVTEEVVRVLGVHRAWLFRFEADRSITVLAAVNDPGFPVGARIALDGPSVAARILDTGRPARIESYADIPGDIAARARGSGVRSSLGVPIIVDGAVWGLVGVGPADERPLPADTEARLSAFTGLLGSSISSAETRDRLRYQADRQASLRRVATLVAAGAPPAELFAAVAEEAVRVVGVAAIALVRFDAEAGVTVVASLNAPAFPVGSRWQVDGPTLAAQILETGRVARIADYSRISGTIAEAVRESGLGAALGIPIVVDGRTWGMACAGMATGAPLPAGTEAQLNDFTELVAVAVSNAESRERLRGLAEQQAALRRVATLAAKGAPPAQLLSTVARELVRILDVSAASVVRFEPGSSVVVASVNDPGFPVGSRWPVHGRSLNAMVVATGRPARVDDYGELPGPVAAAATASGIQEAIGVPIIVDDGVWGMVAVGRKPRRDALPAFTGTYTGRLILSTEPAHEIEARLSAFTELVATVISKSQADDDLRRLADEQSALRRVATLVAEAPSPDEIFTAVVEAASQILGLQGIEMARYEGDGNATVIGATGEHPFPLHSALTLDGPSVMAAVRRTGRASRIDDYTALPGTIAAGARSAGIRAAIGAPIAVDGALWGALIAYSTSPEPILDRAEIRLSEFTELVATAVSNATARADLIASRARIVAAADEGRRRLERNLHDGTQQRLIALGLDLRRIRATLPEGQHDAQAGLEDAGRDLESVLEEVREISRGLHPVQLSRGGLDLALRSLARRSPIPVVIDARLAERPPESVETAVYYVVSEALTNAIKHSEASEIAVGVESTGPTVRATVADDGIGGATPGAGSGLTGLRDRVEALGGRFALESSRERGTAITIELPITTPKAH